MRLVLIQVSSYLKFFLPLLLVGGQTLGVFKPPRDEFDYNRCYINKEKWNWTFNCSVSSMIFIVISVKLGQCIFFCLFMRTTNDEVQEIGHWDSVYYVTWWILLEFFCKGKLLSIYNLKQMYFSHTALWNTHPNEKRGLCLLCLMLIYYY